MVNLAERHALLNATHVHSIGREDYRRSENIDYEAIHADMVRSGMVNAGLVAMHVDNFAPGAHIRETKTHAVSKHSLVPNNVCVMINNASYAQRDPWEELVMSFTKEYVRLSFWNHSKNSCNYVVIKKIYDLPEAF